MKVNDQDIRQAYTFYPGSDKLDASLTLMHAYGARINRTRMLATYAAIHHELGHGSAMLYRYSGVEKEESTFVACAFWRVEALANLDGMDEANAAMSEIFDHLCDNGNIETFNEMFDVNTGLWRGNLPQGLSHLALICAAAALSSQSIPASLASGQRGVADAD